MQASPVKGISLIELLIGMVVIASLLALAVSNFGAWIQNSQIRAAAEGMLNGLQLARATAVQRNSLVNFQLTTSLTDACTLSADGAHWVISMDDASGACAAAPGQSAAPRIVQTRSGQEGSPNVAVAADVASFAFNGLGRRVNAGSTADININFTNAVGGACLADNGPMRCLRVLVSSSGQIRLCDPAVAAADPRAC